jgi:hypothetical protein
MGIDISQRPIYLENINSFLLEELSKIFQFTSIPTRGAIFRSGISVPFLNALNACLVFSGKLVLLFFFFMMSRLFFFLCFSASCFLSLRSNQYFVVH